MIHFALIDQPEIIGSIYVIVTLMSVKLYLRYSPSVSP